MSSVKEFEELLLERGATARSVWSDHFANFRGGPRDAASLWTATGGIDFAEMDWCQFRARQPALWEILQAEGIVETRHSHGALYYFADPCMYVCAPRADQRRKRIDSRLSRTLKALPKRLTHSDMEFWECLGIIAGLELVRTDLCSVLWNELALRAQGKGSDDRVAEAMKGLAWLSRVFVWLLPTLRPISCQGASEMDLTRKFACPTLTEDHLACGPLATSAVRSRRASDTLLLLWSSLLRLVSNEDVWGSRYWIFGNAFGAIDLAFYVVEALRLVGVPHATASICRVGRCRDKTSREPVDNNLVLWPEDDSPPEVILFCDDSISSGQTYMEFQKICAERYPNARLRPFFLTYDLNENWNSDDTAMSRFELADCATARAPWSPGASEGGVVVSSTDQLLESMLSSSDEQLRWIARTQTLTVRRLNA